MTMAQARIPSEISTGKDEAQSSRELDRADEALVVAAKQVRESAYAPYSMFRVGAAVRTASGDLYVGCNVENASYGLAVCAERAAAFAAVSAEGPECQIVAVAVYTEADTCAPCGACRQVLAEFGADAAVTFLSDGRFVTHRLAELLPYRFLLGDG
jgi:cytidine deaminase